LEDRTRFKAAVLQDMVAEMQEDGSEGADRYRDLQLENSRLQQLLAQAEVEEEIEKEEDEWDAMAASMAKLAVASVGERHLLEFIEQSNRRLGTNLASSSSAGALMGTNAASSSSAGGFLAEKQQERAPSAKETPRDVETPRELRQGKADAMTAEQEANEELQRILEEHGQMELLEGDAIAEETSSSIVSQESAIAVHRVPLPGDELDTALTLDPSKCQNLEDASRATDAGLASPGRISRVPPPTEDLVAAASSASPQAKSTPGSASSRVNKSPVPPLDLPKPRKSLQWQPPAEIPGTSQSLESLDSMESLPQLSHQILQSSAKLMMVAGSQQEEENCSLPGRQSQHPPPPDCLPSEVDQTAYFCIGSASDLPQPLTARAPYEVPDIATAMERDSWSGAARQRDSWGNVQRSAGEQRGRGSLGSDVSQSL